MIKLQKFYFLFYLLLAHAATAQVINERPAMLLTQQTPFIGTSFYLPDSNKIMTLSKGSVFFYSKEGKEINPSITIHKNGADLLHSRISPSGKLIAYCTEPDMFYEDGKMLVFNRDSGYVTGQYKVPGSSTLERVNFSGDTVLQYYSQFSDFRLFYTWNMNSGNIRKFNLREDSVYDGYYDLAFLNKNIYVMARYADTLLMSFINKDIEGKENSSFYIANNTQSKIKAQFSQGYPYAILSDIDKKQTSIFKPGDSSFKSIYTMPFVAEIIATAGTEQSCYIIYNDSSKNNPVKLFNAATGKIIALPFSKTNFKDYIFYIHPLQDLVTASHQTNGSIFSYTISDGKVNWSFSPPQQNSYTSTLHDSTDNKLFKVLIKQGSSDINNWHFNQEKNHLYLIKNQNKLVTVDADAKCALNWEHFYKDDNRVTNAELLPGYRYILYTEERWKKDPTAFKKNYDDKMETDPDVRKKEQFYPYSCRIYDRNSGKDIFSLLAIDEPDVRVLNDSLVCFWDRRDRGLEHDSLLIYNLNSGIAHKKILSQSVVMNYKPIMVGEQFYSFITNIDDEILLLNEDGKEIFNRSHKRESGQLSKVNMVEASPYFYLDAASTTSSAQLFKITKDAVIAQGKLPANIDILATKNANSGCYFLYKKKIMRKAGDMVYYRIVNIINGQDKIVDSILYDEDKSYASYQLFPDDNYFLENDNSIISWRDMNSGNEFKDFGRNEPAIVSLVYSADGRYLAAANPGGKVMLWDLGTGKETKTLHVEKSGYITKLAFSGDGKWLAASSGDIWETASGKNVVSVTDGNIWEVNSIDFSSDGKRIVSAGACIISWDAADGSKLYFQQEPREKDMDTTGTCWKPQGCVDPKFAFMAHSTAFHPNGRDFVTGNISGLVQKWNTENRQLQAHQFLSEIPGQVNNKIHDIKYSADGKYIIAVQEKIIYRLDGNTLAIKDSSILPAAENILAINMGYDSLHFGCISSRNNERMVQIRSINDLSVIKEFYTEGAAFNKVTFSPNKKQLATASDDGFCTIWDIESGKPVMYLNTIGEYGNIMVTPDNYYMASKSALDGVSFSKDDNFYSFDQFDLYLNRPDIVLQRLGFASAELINFYRSAYLKRLKKATGAVTDSSVSKQVPVLKLNNRKNIAMVTATGTVNLHFVITDSSTQKGTAKIFINGNLIKEKTFKKTSNILFDYADTILLSQGVNNIEAVYSSYSSIESRKEKLIISHSPAKPVAAKTWFIGIGISGYQNTAMNLKYPAKDVRDLAAAFKKKYPTINIDTLIDAKATKENIIALKNKLMKTGINDKVIVSFNGHGLLSDSLDWYFATYHIDIKKPEADGLSYAAMEELLNGIPARQKLLLLDACHSGEVDKEKDITFANKETSLQTNVVTTPRGTIVIGKSKAGLQTSFEMMQELFTSLNNGNGTTVLSAAGGREYALESDQWKNGVFTYSILKALKDPATDENMDKKVSVKELKKVVFEAVKALTGGRQKPTSRVELLDDWNIW